MTIKNESTTPMPVDFKRNPFRTYCDTFWNLGSMKDEDVYMCRKWWTCLETQWQCKTGQCIDMQWVLDEEWDCPDASDEEALFASENPILDRNLQLIDESALREKFNFLYKKQSFWNICNLTIEYPCFQFDSPEALNISHYRPCIDHKQIGDGQIDCAGGLDERNTITLCHVPVMLGYHYKCLTNQQCSSYGTHCEPICVDKDVLCLGYQKVRNCSSSFDFTCLDGHCAKNGWCDGKYDCSQGEDESICIRQGKSRSKSSDELYRLDKERSILEAKKELHLPRLPIEANDINITEIEVTSSSKLTIQTADVPQISSPLSFWCNRGVGVQSLNDTIACFCPPQLNHRPEEAYSLPTVFSFESISST
ncbi:unnamed protein product [Rotaria sp. Silwood2]|nr:unnamed protein product [Rotaria sp. Silwood2]CAF4080735.1 unnamed protein product [Rotaria sp. Silwood2]CAF4163871.1 unnamed protein product [Rotaria sp. Silwood2]